MTETLPLHNGSLASPQQAALKICNDVIATPMPSVADIPGRDTLITAPWLHNEMHEAIPSLPAHAIVTYHGRPTPRSWHVEGKTISGIGRQGTIGIVPAGWDGRWDIGGEGAVAYVFLSAGRFGKSVSPLVGGRLAEILPRVAEADMVGANIMQALIQEAAEPDTASRLFFDQAVDLLCTHLLRKHTSLSAMSMRISRQGMAPWQVKRVTAHIRENLERTIGLDELAELVSLSRSHFCTAFRRATGTTPHGWLTMRRMERAQELLHDPTLEVTEIALLVGYQTNSAFSASFRRHVGCSPSQFRRKL